MAPTAPALTGRPGNALAPKLNLQQLLRQATHPAEVDDRKASIGDIIDGLKRLNAKRDLCVRADEMYDGDVGMQYASEAVARMLERQGVEHIEDFNYAHIPVDAVANRLKITSVVAGPDEDDAEETAADADTRTETEKSTSDAKVKQANKAIARLRKENELDAEEKRLHHDVSKHGDCYVLVWPGTSAKGEPTVDIRVNSAHNVIMVYDEEDQLKPAYVLKSWRVKLDEQESVRANLYYPDRIERWATVAGGNPDREDDWFPWSEVPDVDEEDLEDLAADEFTDAIDDEAGREAGETDPPGRDDLGDWTINNPYGRVPWWHFRNNRPEGVPEHRNAYGPQTIINKIVYALAGDVDFQSLPQKYLLVDPMQDDPLQNLINPDHPDDDEDDPENTGGTSGLRSEPGEIWRLYGKSVGQFEPGDPARLIALLDRCVRSMGELTETAQWRFFRDSGDLPSGEAARELNADETMKIGDRQARYDPQWEGVYEFALELLGIEGVTVDVRWAPIVMVNDVAGWQVVNAKIGAGVPPQVALEESGYPREQVAEWLKDANGADLGRRIALLNQIGTAVQTIGAGIALGAVSKTQAQAVIAGVLGLTLEGTDIELPEPSEEDYVDPQQQKLEAAKAMQDAQLGHQGEQNQATREHATATQQAAQEHARTMAVEAHERAKAMQEHQQKLNGGQPTAGQGPRTGGRRAGGNPPPRRTGR